jgi:Fe-S-cluster-containing dehydrogenase component
LRFLSFDPEKCVGCSVCQLVCSGTWQKVFNPYKAKIRIEPTGWYGHFEARVCRQGPQAECVAACPTGALYRDERRGVVAFDPKKCDGCKQCLGVCPYQAIFDWPDHPFIFKCDLCGGGKIQQCVEACPREALSVLEVNP